MYIYIYVYILLTTKRTHRANVLAMKLLGVISLADVSKLSTSTVSSRTASVVRLHPPRVISMERNDKESVLIPRAAIMFPAAAFDPASRQGAPAFSSGL